ncbi:hypothetical protein ACJQWK_08141 [Exserohilum turcicum]|uniref:Xaa-Pro dipeptidyl-peptidase C-terminal domain-containing protein n=1 Tax=Exserohilum turcicum (strain 28A) TaxID=671987 RepID=R0KII3_EXST2|nr:uncharacterized protein SETTUDRAFT_108687 [Exserohilum turcica Et28A]EOA87857.1 hypothetical protein SETTUDRAFT_108687 [Exserohilum turcica Et28A]
MLVNKNKPCSNVQGVEVPLEAITPPQVGEAGYEGLKPRSEVLPQGWQHPSHPGAKALPCDILVEHDVAIPARDGITLYADILRPTEPPSGDCSKVPALICWSPFGKKFNGILSLRYMTPWDLGLPPDALSGLEKFEAPDPADWVPRGYAIVNIDSRGSGDSGGTMVVMGQQEAEDGYDAIEHVAKLHWCNGSVGLAGNSHLAIAQWFIAALRPPSLKAIAPWEGCGDLYREQFARGGIYSGDLFDKLILKHMLHGNGNIESFRLMFEQHPLANAWWNDKRPDMKRINVPTYITGTWTNTMHGMGAIRAWLEVDSADKWLRWHPWQEWYDLWGNPQAKEELGSFFDHYLKGADNGWEKTPRVRMALLRFGKKEPQSFDNIVEEDFPPARTQYRQAFLSQDQELRLGKEAGPSAKLTYDSESDDCLVFTHKFSETTRIMGIPKAVLYMSCADHDDMDVYVTLEKLDKNGHQMMNLNIPWDGVPAKSFSEIKPEEATEVVVYKGPCGIMRASHRAIHESKSMHPNWPFHPHEVEEKVKPGDVVRLDIGIWATGIEFEAGESIRVVVGGRNRCVSNFGSHRHVLNRGTHEVHIGGEFGSYISLPFV